MKKIYLSVALVLMAFMSFGQGDLVERPEAAEHFQTRDFNKSYERAGGILEWFNYGEEIYNFGGDVSYFRIFAWPDSTVLTEFSSGLGNVWKHSLGQVFDPYTGFFEVNHQPVVGAYGIDSIAIPYRYLRVQDDAPDTVVVQFYEQNRILFSEDPGWTSGASYATVEYDYMTNKGLNPTEEVTLLLTNDDTITSTQGFITLPVFRTVAEDQHFAMTISYKPGNEYNFGDTVDIYFDPQPDNRRNAFILYEFRDNDKTVDAGVYNNAVTASTEVRYNINSNGWNGRYIPGTAWNSGFYSLDAYFLVSNPPTLMSVEDNDLSAHIKAFPNPTNGQLTVTLPQLNEQVQYRLINAVGQVVMEGSIVSSQASFDISELGTGIYSLNLYIDGATYTRKINKL